jgi:hypothetical protein
MGEPCADFYSGRKATHGTVCSVSRGYSLSTVKLLYPFSHSTPRLQPPFLSPELLISLQNLAYSYYPCTWEIYTLIRTPLHEGVYTYRVKGGVLQ